MSTDYTPRLHVVLYQPEIPYNTGSVGRTCVAVGAKLWLVRPLGFRVDDYYLRRAGLDYWQHLQWEVVDDWAKLLEHLPAERHWYFSKKATRPFTTGSFQPDDVLVFGCESSGLPPDLLEAHPRRRTYVPVRRGVRSLNLANVVSLGVYTALVRAGVALPDNDGSYEPHPRQAEDVRPAERARRS